MTIPLLGARGQTRQNSRRAINVASIGRRQSYFVSRHKRPIYGAAFGQGSLFPSGICSSIPRPRPGMVQAVPHPPPYCGVGRIAMETRPSGSAPTVFRGNTAYGEQWIIRRTDCKLKVFSAFITNRHDTTTEPWKNCLAGGRVLGYVIGPQFNRFASRPGRSRRSW